VLLLLWQNPAPAMLNSSVRSTSSAAPSAPQTAAQLAAEESRRTKRTIAEKKRRERQFRQDLHQRLQQKVRPERPRGARALPLLPLRSLPAMLAQGPASPRPLSVVLQAPAPAATPEPKSVLAERRRNEMISDRRKVQERARKEKMEAEQKRRAAEVQYRVQAPIRTAEVQELHELAAEQRERQMQEAQLLQAEMMHRAEADAKPSMEKVTAKRYNKAVRAALTDKIAALPQELPPLSPSGCTLAPPTGEDTPLCWGVNGWAEPAANCPFKSDMAGHDALLRQMVAQWAVH
jgi:hypothetical protein